MNKYDENITMNINISELIPRIIDFIKNNMESIEPYEEIQEMYVFHEHPVIMDATVRRVQEILYINITYKLIDINNSSDDGLKFLKEGVYVCTHFSTNYLSDITKVNTFLNKIVNKLEECVFILSSKVKILKFDIVESNMIKFFELYRNANRRSIRKITNIDILSNKVVSRNLLNDIIASLLSDLNSQSDFEQYRIHFSDLEIAGGISYTSFTILINLSQYDKKENLAYVTFDIVNDDLDRDKAGMNQYEMYGVAAVANRPHNIVMSTYRFDIVHTENINDLTNKVSDKLYQAIKLLSSSCKVREILIERKEI